LISSKLYPRRLKNSGARQRKKLGMDFTGKCARFLGLLICAVWWAVLGLADGGDSAFIELEFTFSTPTVIANSDQIIQIPAAVTNNLS